VQWFLSCSELVACAATLAMQLLNETALASAVRRDRVDVLAAAHLPRLSAAAAPAALLNHLLAAASGQAPLRPLLRHAATLALALQCAYCLVRLGGLRMPGEGVGGSSGPDATKTKAAAPKAAAPMAGQRKAKKERRRRRVIEESDDEDEDSGH
jgi:hypothetical protein